MSVLELNHVKKSFNNGELEVLQDISLSVEKGEVVAIIGPSGSGKSTLLRCATLLERIDSGEVCFDGRYAAHTRRRHRRLRRQGGAQADPQLLWTRFPAVQSLSALLGAQKRHGRTHLRPEA